jgi:hypothetical protein
MIYNIYKSPDLYGDFLTKPLRNYRAFVNREDTKKGLLLRKIVHIATAIFAYPIFGVLAAVGIVVKSFSIPSISEHNNRQKRGANLINTEDKHFVGLTYDLEESIDYHSAKFRKVFVAKNLQGITEIYYQTY